MCGNTHRPTYGGTIAVLFPQQNTAYPKSSPSGSLSSSPDSTASSSSSTSTISSYSLFFRDPETSKNKTRAIFQIDDAETYDVLRAYRHLDMSIEKYGDLSTRTADPPIHQFKLDLSQAQRMKSGLFQREMEFELPEKLDLGVSENGVVGRQVTMREAGGSILGVGIVGYN